jgi:hypothetical protein
MSGIFGCMSLTVLSDIVFVYKYLSLFSETTKYVKRWMQDESTIIEMERILSKKKKTKQT